MVSKLSFLRIVRAVLIMVGVGELAFLISAARCWLPAEDAVILFHYSRNLALHGAITFNYPGLHVEGATDFLWMVLLAAAIKLHVQPYVFTACMNVLALLGLGAVFARLAGRRITIPLLLAVAGAAALVPQSFAAVSGFAVLPDALILATLVLATLRRRCWTASVLSLLLCLMRPDGMLFAAPLLLWCVLSSDDRRMGFTALFCGFVLPGVCYFAWRWQYFHEFFPLPFLVKRKAARILGVFVPGSFHGALLPLLFLLSVLTVVAWSGRSGSGERVRQSCLLAVVLVGAPTLFYSSMRLDQDVAGRFFFYLPLTAALVIALNWDMVPKHKLAVTCAVGWLLCYATPLDREWRTFRDMQFDGIDAIGQQLAKLPGPASLLSTEAGFLPYETFWFSIDPWGLNTPAFAHKLIQPRDVADTHADVVVIHPDLPDSCVPSSPRSPAFGERTWGNMTRNLVSGATSSGYELWLVSYGSEYYRKRHHWEYGEGDRECWYLNVRSPRHDGIVDVLKRNHAVSPDRAAAMEAVHASSLHR